MTLYDDSAYLVRDDLDAIHASQLEKFSEPGTWGSAAQRLAVLNEARKAGYEAGVLEEPAEAGDDHGIEISEPVRQVIKRLAVSPKDIEQDFYDQALKDGLSDAEYVEIVGLVSRITDFDVFARGIGVPLRPLPASGPGEPSRDRPAEAVLELAWAPTVPNPPEGGAFADELYDGQQKSYIVRALSLVPDEFRANLELEVIQYLPQGKIRVADYQHHEGLTRSQVEVVAGRVSALNECFFWTSGHAWFLRESGRKTDLNINIEALIRPELDIGVPGGDLLLEFSDAVIGPDRARLDKARIALAEGLSPAAVPAASAIAANFTKNDRIANGLGIPVDPMVVKLTKEICEQLGLNDYRSAVNTFRHM